MLCAIGYNLVFYRNTSEASAGACQRCPLAVRKSNKECEPSKKFDYDRPSEVLVEEFGVLYDAMLRREAWEDGAKSSGVGTNAVEDEKEGNGVKADPNEFAVKAGSSSDAPPAQNSHKAATGGLSSAFAGATGGDQQGLLSGGVVEGVTDAGSRDLMFLGSSQAEGGRRGNPVTAGGASSSGGLFKVGVAGVNGVSCSARSGKQHEIAGRRGGTSGVVDEDDDDDDDLYS